MTVTYFHPDGVRRLLGAAYGADSPGTVFGHARAEKQCSEPCYGLGVEHPEHPIEEEPPRDDG